MTTKRKFTKEEKEEVNFYWWKFTDEFNQFLSSLRDDERNSNYTVQELEEFDRQIGEYIHILQIWREKLKAHLTPVKAHVRTRRK